MLSDEERKAIESLIEIREFANLSSYKDVKINQLNAIDTILNLIEKQSKEIEELIERIKELEQENREIREWKYVIDNPIDLEKLKELDLIKIKGKEYISKDNIKAIIEELQEDIKYSANPLSIDNSKFGIKVLQSLLDKE